MWTGANNVRKYNNTDATSQIVSTEPVPISTVTKIEFCVVGCLHEASTWKDNSRFFRSLDFVATERVYFDVVL